jgi:hypothetical protein
VKSQDSESPVAPRPKLSTIGESSPQKVIVTVPLAPPTSQSLYILAVTV